MSAYSSDNPEGNPWTFISETVNTDDPWISHCHHKLLNHQGKQLRYNVVKFKNRAVGVVPYENGLVTLVGQYRYTIGRYSWEIPEGGCPEGEEPIEAAIRELKEETGLSAGRYETLLEMHLSNAVTDEWGVVFLATDLTQGQAEPDGNEVLQTRRVTLDALLQSVERGLITDSLTVAATYKLALLKAQGKLD